MTEFDDIVAGLELDIDPDAQPVSYKDWSPWQLLKRWNEVKRILLDHGAFRNPTKEEDIDLQSEYMSLLQEMRKRGMK